MKSGNPAHVSTSFEWNHCNQLSVIIKGVAHCAFFLGEVENWTI